jgi:hypothetical protein
MDEGCSAQFAQKVVSGIAANAASVQMIVDLQLPIQIQLFVDELQQPVKAACAHNAPWQTIAPTSVPNSVDSAHRISTFV